MKRLPFLIGMIIFVSALRAELTAKSYILDGLVAHWDGIENVSYGGAHDNSVATWTDLTGNGVNLSIPSGASFVDSGLSTVRANGSSGLSSKLSTVYATGNYTVEFSYWQPTNTLKSSQGWGRTMCVMLILGNSTQWVGTYDNQVGFCPTGNRTESQLGKFVSLPDASAVTNFHSFACCQNTNTYKVVFDAGAKSASGAATQGATSTGHGVRFNMNYYSDHGLAGVYHAMRFYDRPLGDDEIKVNHIVDAIRFNGADPSDYVLPEGWKFEIDGDDVSLFKLLKIRVKSGSGDGGYGTGGKIRISGGEATTEGSAWCEKGKTVNLTLSAEADEGYVFVGWSGVPDADKYNAQTTTEAGADVTAVFRSADDSDPKDYVFVGAAGDAWDDPYSWNDENGFGGVPMAGDSATVPNGKSVLLTNSTPRLASLSVAGTVVMTNWTTCLCADAITVSSGGRITCGAAAETAEGMSRVNIACGDLTVEPGGTVEANAKGFKGGNTTHKSGYGPGAIQSDACIAGGGHGGIGSYSTYNSVPRAALATNEYGSASAPLTAGSGGWGGNGRGGNGGGVVTIAASGCVAVYGSVTADAEGSVTGNSSAGGAGGSVFITTKTFTGAYGRISAKGGTALASYSQNYHSGGGGRVAILFDKTAQAALPCPRGMYYGADTGGFLAPTENTFMDCLPGSLYFSSDTLIDRSGATLFGKLDFADVTDKWTVDSICLTNGWVMMARDGVEVEVTGDFEVTGDTLVTRRYNASTAKSTDATGGTRWDVGGAALYFATNGLSVYRMSSAVPRLTVGGDLKVNKRALLYVYSSQEALDPAAGTPATTNLGAQVTVTGAIELSDIGKMYVKSHPRTGVSPSFSAGSLSVSSNSWIDANNTGFFGRNTDSYNSVCTLSLSPTTTTGKNGAGHGGAGGGGKTSPTAKGAGTYDSLDWPVLCGGGGYCDYQYNFPGLGGGVLRFFVAGEVSVDGSMRANATSSGNFSGGPAGGTVLISCDHISGEGNVEAKGSNGYKYTAASSVHNGGGGGGGRIAIHYNVEAQSNATCKIVFNAAGGVGVGNGIYTGNGKSGTVWFTDDAVVSEGMSHTGSLYVPDLINFIRRDSMVIENALTEFEPGGYVEIEHDLTIRGASAGSAGFDIPKGHFRVGGNLIIEKAHITVTGDAAHPRTDIFRVGGNMMLDNAMITVECSDEDRDQAVSIGGSIVMTNATTITLKSPCNEVEGEPGLVFGAQKLEMYNGCWIYPWSHNTNGASVLVCIPEISCVSNSGFNADAKGYGRATGASGAVYGPKTTALNGCGREVNGQGANSTIAPGHGGDGGNALQVSGTYPRGVGIAFDDRRRPVFAGPGGAGGYQSNVPPRGGGVIRIESTVLDLGGGTLTANGGGGVAFRAGGAGGSIYVKADRFLGNGGFLSANGGKGGYYGFSEQINNHKGYCMAGGGGGRIAVHFKNDISKGTNVTTSVKGGECPLDVEKCRTTYGEDVSGLKAQRDGKDGTVYWGAPRGLRIIVK